ncbi:MAG: rod shape-determining protein RodA [bacterium]
MFDERRTNNSLIKEGFSRLRIDQTLAAGILLLMGMSLVVLYSASGESLAVLQRQLIRDVLGLVLMVAVVWVGPRRLYLWSPIIYLGGTFLLLAVLLFGDVGKGAQRWLELGGVRFQPSEIMKLAMPLMLSFYFAERRLPPTLKESLVAAMLMVIPVLLILKQPDLGTAILVSWAGVMVIFLAGLSWRVIVSMVVMAAAAGPFLWRSMHEYQRQRVMTLLDAESDPLGAGYHIIQSKIAIGSGGIYGDGWLQGTQGQLQFLPERHTDFIFAVLGEEFGLVGVLVLFLVYLLIVARGLYIAYTAPDTYGRLLAGSLSMTFFIYFFVNVGMVTGLLPVVGVPLPLISYGGTSMVTLMMGFGMLMAIQSEQRLVSK